MEHTLKWLESLGYNTRQEEEDTKTCVGCGCVLWYEDTGWYEQQVCDSQCYDISMGYENY